MQKKSTQTKWKGSVLELSYGAKTVPDSVVLRHINDLKSALDTRRKERNEVRRYAARYLKKLQKPISPDTKVQSGVAGAGDRARQIRERMVKKATLPKLPVQSPGGIVSYSIRFVPPYDYASIVQDLTGPGNNCYADRFSGQMSWAFSDESSYSLGYVCQVEMGSFFFTPKGLASYDAVLQASIDPSYAFAWWLNNLGGITALQASIATHIDAYKGTTVIESAVSNEIKFFDESMYGPLTEIQFDWGSDSSAPMLAQMQLTEADFYLVYLNIWGEGGAGSGGIDGPVPGAPTDLVGGLVNIMLPSITLKLVPSPVIAGA